MPAALAEKARQNIRSTIERLLSSYARRKRSAPEASTAPYPGPGKAKVEPSSPTPADMPSTDHKNSNGHPAHNLDVTMAESTVTFENTMCINDLDGGAVAPPPCVSSVLISAELAKAIEEDLKVSSGIIDGHNKKAMLSRHILLTAETPRTPRWTHKLQWFTFEHLMLTTRPYGKLWCARSRTLALQQ